MDSNKKSSTEIDAIGSQKKSSPSIEVSPQKSPAEMDNKDPDVEKGGMPAVRDAENQAAKVIRDGFCASSHDVGSPLCASGGFGVSGGCAAGSCSRGSSVGGGHKVGGGHGHYGGGDHHSNQVKTSHRNFTRFLFLSSYFADFAATALSVVALAVGPATGFSIATSILPALSSLLVKCENKTTADKEKAANEKAAAAKKDADEQAAVENKKAAAEKKAADEQAAAAKKDADDKAAVLNTTNAVMSSKLDDIKNELHTLTQAVKNPELKVQVAVLRAYIIFLASKVGVNLADF